MKLRVGGRQIAALAVVSTALGSACAWADALPFLPAGDARLRHLVQLAADDDQIPLASSWPISTLDLPEAQRSSLHSLQQPGTSMDAGWYLSGSVKATQIRTFDDTPREKGEAGVQGAWAAGDYAGGVMKIGYAVKPQDGRHFRFDDSYASWRLGNWWFTAGEQQRWWGPGWDGSLVLSNNARPLPAISLDRARSLPFESKWLRWIGPWRISTFMARFENDRVDFPHPLLWGFRGSFRPLKSLEISLSRTAQWCRPHVCGLSAFKNVLSGRDNRGDNVGVSREPGNQEISWDARWRLPKLPAAVYLQVNGETGELGTVLPRPRQTTDVIGMEIWSSATQGGSWRVFTEWAGTTCGEFSFNKSDQPNPNCQYNNGLFTGGYYYRGRVLGHSLQGDGRLFTIGGLYVDPEDRTWEFRLRKGKLNRFSASTLNTLTPVAANLWNAEAKVDARFRGITYSLGVGGDRVEPDGGERTLSMRAFLNLTAPWPQ